MAVNNFRYLGGSGVSVSPICLGTMIFSDSPPGSFTPVQCSEEVSHQILDRYVELGGNFIDTANVYGTGASERIVGRWLAKQQREKIVLATKVRFPMDPANPNAVGLNRKNIFWSVNESLKRLQTDYIDLLQIHAWDDATPLEETLQALNDLVKSGKVHYVGASNVYGWQLQKIMDYNKFMGFNKWVSLQIQYSLLNRETESEHLPVCRNESLGILPWSPLRGGWLTGKITRGVSSAPKGSRVEFSEQNPSIPYQCFQNFSKNAAEERIWILLDNLERISKETGKTMAQVAIRWLLQKEAVCSVIIGCKTVAQLEDNMGAGTGWELSDEQMAALDEVSPRLVTEFDSLMTRNHSQRSRTSWTQ